MGCWLSHAVVVLGLAGVIIYRLIRIYCRINECSRVRSQL